MRSPIGLAVVLLLAGCAAYQIEPGATVSPLAIAQSPSPTPVASSTEPPRCADGKVWATFPDGTGDCIARTPQASTAPTPSPKPIAPSMPSAVPTASPSLPAPPSSPPVATQATPSLQMPAAPSPTIAPATPTLVYISGAVLGPSLIGIESATVSVVVKLPNGESYKKSIKVGLFGLYSLLSIPNGEIYLTAEAPGFKAKNISVFAPADGKIQRDLVLDSHMPPRDGNWKMEISGNGVSESHKYRLEFLDRASVLVKGGIKAYDQTGKTLTDSPLFGWGPTGTSFGVDCDAAKCDYYNLIPESESVMRGFMDRRTDTATTRLDVVATWEDP